MKERKDGVRGSDIFHEEERNAVVGRINHPTAILSRGGYLTLVPPRANNRK